ncbi:MAG: HlyC/CorC family transporter [Saprospiraceae bacterium]|nr:HlyC/CorC family transporter [Saprospiraceae bacterium]
MEILIIIGLILLNGIFAMAEMSLVSSRKFKLESEKKKGNLGAIVALDLSENPTRFFSTVQIGITLIGILLGVFSGEKLTVDIENYFAQFEILRPYTHNIAVGIIVVSITYLSIVFGELLPKKIGMTFPEPIAIMLARPMKILSRMTSPFVWLLTFTNDTILKMFGLNRIPESYVSEEEIKSIIKESTVSGEIQDIENEIVDRVFELGDRKINSLMTHRRDITYFDVTDDIYAIRQKIGQEPHSAYPVTEHYNLDNTIGIVMLKDLFEGCFDAEFQIKNFIKQPLYLSENTPAFKLLDLFKEEKMHYALITDEYGSIKGYVTMDDVVDALVGDLSQEHQSEYSIIDRTENTWLVDGQFSLTEFMRKFKLDEIDVGEEYHTVGGLIIGLKKSIPKEGDTVDIENLTLEVIDMDGPRIDKILVTNHDE